MNALGPVGGKEALPPEVRHARPAARAERDVGGRVEGAALPGTARAPCASSNRRGAFAPLEVEDVARRIVPSRGETAGRVRTATGGDAGTWKNMGTVATVAVAVSVGLAPTVDETTKSS